MKTARVDSSVIARLRYEGETNVLEVTFHNGRVYDYFFVPARVYDAFREAESAGAFFNRHVRDAFPCKRKS